MLNFGVFPQPVNSCRSSDMKQTAALLLLMTVTLFSSSCMADSVDVSALTPEHRALFAGAAAVEGVDVTLHGLPWDWTIEYASLQKSAGHATYDNLQLGYCAIIIDPSNMLICRNGGLDQFFISLSRHELRHCQGLEHSDDPQKLMFPNVPCWPID